MPTGSNRWKVSRRPRVEATREGLRLTATTAADDGVLGDFYAAYDRAFVLPNEKESLGGFKGCLALNEGEAYRRLALRYGPFREVVLVAHDIAGALVGGANFIAFPLARPAPVLSMNLNYAFVEPEQRRKGHLSRLLRLLPGIAGAFFNQPTRALPVLTFIEQNNPFRMSPEDYRRDSKAAGLDQVTRIRIWAGLGARIVEFAYVQPPLSADQMPDESLVYAVLGAEGGTIDACLLHDHLERFFGISVLKGAPVEGNAAARSQLQMLARDCEAGAAIRLVNPTDWLAAQENAIGRFPPA